ncbi:hypothetical protein SFR_6205 [Streptomyces sp. FR-008]|nr:hypothetical protein SFR_6205 [Streptomyces sp. FR-008]
MDHGLLVLRRSPFRVAGHLPVSFASPHVLNEPE